MPAFERRLRIVTAGQRCGCSAARAQRVGGRNRRTASCRRSQNIEYRILRRHRIRVVFLGFSVAAVVANASALGRTWPTKPIRAIGPFTAGSASDIVPRTVFEQLSGELGQSIIVEKKSGAGGTIGAAAVARSEPDGYAHTIVPSLYPNTPYDPARDFEAIIPLATCPMCLWSLPPRASGRFRISGELSAEPWLKGARVPMAANTL
jgi:hypothetical protein